MIKPGKKPCHVKAYSKKDEPSPQKEDNQKGNNMFGYGIFSHQTNVPAVFSRHPSRHTISIFPLRQVNKRQDQSKKRATKSLLFKGKKVNRGERKYGGG